MTGWATGMCGFLSLNCVTFLEGAIAVLVEAPFNLSVGGALEHLDLLFMHYKNLFNSPDVYAEFGQQRSRLKECFFFCL